MDSESVRNLLDDQRSTSDTPLDHLEYDYIGNCSKIKELEKIIKVLRSGKEGVFPDLIRFCENRIEEIDPNSRALRKEKPAATKYDFKSEEWNQVNSDIKDWVSDISNSTAETTKESDDQQNLPPVRKGTTIDTKGKKQEDDSEKVWAKPSKDRIKSGDFKAWDKFDAEAEARKVDGITDEGQRLKDAASDISSSRSAGRTANCIDVEGMTDREREVVANREKDKGNEAFKSADFAEAVTYYSRSISVIPSAPAYNNRALARIKLGKYSMAAVDCTKVIELEPENIKAYLRRATASKALTIHEAAIEDLNVVLGKEPHNKQAKDLLADVYKDMKAKTEPKSKKTSSTKPVDFAPPVYAEKPRGGRRLVITEIEGSDDSEDDQWADAKQEVTTNRKNATNSNRQSGKLVNGSASEYPVSDLAEDVVRNIPLEKESLNGNMDDEVDGGRISRLSSTKKEGRVDETQQNQLNSAQEKGPQSEREIPSQNVNDASQQSASSIDAQVSLGTETVPLQENPVKPPAAPKVERPLPPVVVAVKDAALTLYKSGQYGEAKDKFTVAIERLVPDKDEFGSALASLYSNRAACYSKTGDTKDCIEDCDSALAINPYNGKVLIRRGAAYEARERYRHAYVDFQQAMSYDPLNRVTQGSCSRLASLLKDQDGSNWREKLPSNPSMPPLPKMPPILTTMAPSNANVPANTSTTKATMTTMASGQRSKGTEQPKVKPAEVAAATMVEDKPPALTKEERFQNLKVEGNNFFKKGSHAEAIKCYTSCIDTDPTQVVSYTNRALCYLKLTQFAKAETDCSMALALDTINIKALYRRALARKGLKEYKKSAQDLSNLLKMDSQNKDASKELDVVKDLWRKELTAAKSDSTKPAGGSSSSGGAKKTNKKPTRVQIEEVDTEDNDEKENSATGRPQNQKATATSKGGKSAKTNGSQETGNKSTKQSANKKAAGRPNADPLSTNITPKLGKVTAYEFMQGWMSLKGTRNLAGYAELLKQVPPTELPKVLSNKLDGDMLAMILRATSEHLVEKDAVLSFGILNNLLSVERFNTMVMFLSGKDKKVLRKGLERLQQSSPCEAYTVDDLKRLRKNYSL